MNNNKEFNIEQLFEELLIQKPQKIKKSILKQHEEKQINILHNINNSSIESTFDLLINHDNSPFRKGKKYGMLEIINDEMILYKKRNWYKCKCTCGQELLQRPDILIKNKANSCLSCAKKISTLRINDFCRNKSAQIGQVFGKRTVIEITGRINKKNEFMVLCKCECGHIGNVRYAKLKKGKSHACSNCTKPGPKKRSKD